MRKKCILLCFCLMLLCNALALADEATNLLPNGGFETLDADGDAVGWYATAYRSQPGYSRMTITNEKAHTGQYSAMVENATNNDARFTCTVEVEPSSLYRLSGYVLVEHMEEGGNGANFGIEDIYSLSDTLFDTQGRWEYLEWYGETGESQTEVTFGVRVGGYSAESVGKAYFDDIVLEKVDSLPRGVYADMWYRENAVKQQTLTLSKNEEEGTKSTVLIVAVGLAFALACALLMPLLERREAKGASIALGVMLALAIVIRVALAITVPGYEVDINCFRAWSLRMAERGPANFYAEDYFCDYPPGYMLLLYPIGLLLRAVGGSSGGMLLAVKLLPMLCDVAGALCLYCFARKRMNSWAAVCLSALYALNPVVLVNGAAWGQADSVLALVLMLVAFAAMKRCWQVALPLYMAAVLLKPQALLFAPVGGVWLLACLFSKEQRSTRTAQLRRVGIGVASALAVAAVIVIPFSVHQGGLNWLFELYGETLGSYARATLNTANLYYLVDANWMPLEQAVPWWLPAATAVALLGFVTQLPLRGRYGGDWRGKRALLALISLGAAVVQLGLWAFGATYAVYGYVMMGYAFLYALVCLLSERRAECLPFYMALSLVGVYVLGVKVHERYLFPALLLLVASYITTRDRRVLGLYVGLSVTTFINTAIVLDNAVLFGASQGHLNDDTLGLNLVLCVLNLALCGYAGWLGMDGLRESAPIVRDAEKPAAASSYQRMLFTPQDARMGFCKKDLAIIGITTALYAALAFSNLGSTSAPQTSWISTSRDEQVVFDLGETRTFSVLYYAGVSYNDFSVSVSENGETWTQTEPCAMRQGLCWQWKYVIQSTEDEDGSVTYSSDSPTNVVWFTGRYLRVNACEPGLNLWEVVARGEDGENIPLTLVSHTGANPDLLATPQNPANLIDETATCVGEPGWYNSMYFDEIYHARSAYHNLHNESPYETTHPPLGKLMIAGGIALFGMTPFGWRFAGTLIGVLMLPALYLLALQLTKKRSVATVSMLAFALDLMHFTQTRIATIDSFPLFFILLTLVCMTRYLQTDVLALAPDEPVRLFTRAFKRSLIPLALCGLFMGLSIASKWTGIYSAVGLALLFFLGVYRQFRASNLACGLVPEDEAYTDEQRARIRNAQDFTLKRILITCGFCVLFFVAVPCLIYALSYIPYLLPDGPYTLKRLIGAQTGMLSYHSTPGLGMDHPFQSPWWQWPFILKPMWFARDSYEPAGYGATIMCMGNPWVFYIGAFAVVGVLIAFVCKYVRWNNGHLALRHGNGDLTLTVLVIGFLAQYLPWVLVPRSMYMYHYFASVPFIIMATAWWLDRLPDKVQPVGRLRPIPLKATVTALYLLGAAVFFVLFFPYASGYLTSTRWLDAMKWFSKLYY